MLNYSNGPIRLIGSSNYSTSSRAFWVSVMFIRDVLGEFHVHQERFWMSVVFIRVCLGDWHVHQGCVWVSVVFIKGILGAFHVHQACLDECRVHQDVFG